MMAKNGKIDKDLLEKIEKLPDTAFVDCLIYPARTVQDLKNLLEQEKKRVPLEYNYLQLAGSFAVKLQKKTLFELAPEKAILRVSGNPTFKTNK